MNPTSTLKGQRLIIHVGMGKTGSTSIQDTLRDQQGALAAQGYRYLGLILEHAPVMNFAWQTRAHAALPMGKQKEHSLRLTQMSEILTASLQYMRDQGEHTAIWSNEALCDVPDEFIHLIQGLREAGVEVEIVIYVRRHDKWARSAYMQWGIKHKTYQGPLLSFHEYFRMRPLNFYQRVNRWMDAFPQQVRLRNFDAAQDVVEDFVNLLKLNIPHGTARVNEAPGAEELLLRAVFNNGCENSVLPELFNRVLQAKKIDFRLDTFSWLQDILPSESDISTLLEESSTDIEEINQLLESQGQQRFLTTDATYQPLNVDRDRLLGILVQIVLQQARQIHSLRTKVDQMFQDIKQKESDNG